MDYRSHGGYWLGPAHYAVEEYADGCAVVSTRWYRRGDEKDFEIEVVRAGLPRAEAEALAVQRNATAAGMRPCNRPAVGDAQHALMCGGGHTLQQRRAAARVWIARYGVQRPTDTMYPVYALAERALA